MVFHEFNENGLLIIPTNILLKEKKILAWCKGNDKSKLRDIIIYLFNENKMEKSKCIFIFIFFFLVT